MGTLYRVSNYGGSITAIMLNTREIRQMPPQSWMDTPCVKKAEWSSLGISATGRWWGDNRPHCFDLLFPSSGRIRPPVRPCEYLLVAVFALSIIAAVIKGRPSRASSQRASG